MAENDSKHTGHFKEEEGELWLGGDWEKRGPEEEGDLTGESVKSIVVSRLVLLAIAASNIALTLGSTGGTPWMSSKILSSSSSWLAAPSGVVSSSAVSHCMVSSFTLTLSLRLITERSKEL